MILKIFFILYVRIGFGSPSPLRIVVSCTSTQTQTIELFCIEVGRQLRYSCKLSPRLVKWFLDKEEQTEQMLIKKVLFSHFRGRVLINVLHWLLSSYTLFTFLFLSLSLSLFLKIPPPPIVELHSSYISSFLTSQSSICTPHSSSLDIYLIRVLLKVVEGVTSCENTVQGLFPH